MAKDAERLEAQAERLRNLKGQARGLTFKQIADAIGATERQAQRWFAGESDPNADNLKKLARFLGTSPDYIEYGVVDSRRDGPTPDLTRSLSTDSELLARIEQKLDALLDHFDIDVKSQVETLARGLSAVVPASEQAPSASPSKRAARGRQKPEAADAS